MKKAKSNLASRKLVESFHEYVMGNFEDMVRREELHPGWERLMTEACTLKGSDGAFAMLLTICGDMLLSEGAINGEYMNEPIMHKDYPDIIALCRKFYEENRELVAEVALESGTGL